jgi:hypothetical protein
MAEKGGMRELQTIRLLVDRGIDKLADAPEDHPLRHVDEIELRRRLAEAAFREIRSLQRESADDGRSG